MKINWEKFIVSTPNVLRGKPRIKGAFRIKIIAKLFIKYNSLIDFRIFPYSIIICKTETRTYKINIFRNI